uniref:Uncharacterized protein n=1 Tax=Lactuca sativa TaxID=4236 RepID=A0A9R1XD77_LACSA|nr:hypothetical protein LSAT_V11C500260740 [Lactuca sativa]
MESPQGGFVNLLQTGSPIQQTTLFQQQYQPFPAFQQQQLQQYQAFQQFQQLQQQQFQPQPQPPHSPDFKKKRSDPAPPKKGSNGQKTKKKRSLRHEFRLPKTRLKAIVKRGFGQFERTTVTRKAFPYVKHWLKLKDALKWKEQTEGSSQSSGSKRSRNPDRTSQQSDVQTHIDINDEPLDLEDEQPLRWPVGRNKAKKAASTTSGSSVMDQFGETFDRY